MRTKEHLQTDDYIPVQDATKAAVAGNCSVCLTDKPNCLPVSYRCIIEFYKAHDASPVGFLVCQNCIDTMNPRDLLKNLVDYLVMNELSNYSVGCKTSLIKSEEEFQDTLEFAVESGIIYRETKRIRKRFAKPVRNVQLNFLDVLVKQKTGNYTPDSVRMNLFKKIYEQN